MKPARHTRSTSGLAQLRRDRPVERRASRKRLVIDHAGGEAGRRARASRPGGVGAIGDDERDRGVERPVRDRVDDRLQVAAPAGNQNAQPAIHGRPAYADSRRRRRPPGQSCSASRLARRGQRVEHGGRLRSPAATTRPMPMLNVRSISSSGTAPAV